MQLVWMTTTEAAIRETTVLMETTSQTPAQKPTTVVRSQDQGPRVEIINNCITTQDNEECLEVVDYGGLDQSRHARQLMPQGTLTDDGESIPIKKPLEELTQKLAAKPDTKTPQNKVIPAIPCTIDLTCWLWSQVAQGSNFNKSECTEVSWKGKPIKQLIHSNQKTKVPGPQHTTEDDRRLIFKRDSKISATTNKDRQLISAINRVLAYSAAPEHIRLYAVSTKRRGTLTGLSSPKAPAKVCMVERVKDIVLKASQLIDSSIYSLDDNNTRIQIKVHHIPLEHYFWRGSLG
jgi:hypothetical protein